MEAFLPIAALIVLAIAGALFGSDSRPIDADRVTGWWPANPQ